MRSKLTFTQSEADAIRKLLREKSRASRSRQKTIRGKIRDKYEFYISDFASSSSGFDYYDFDDLIKTKLIKIISRYK